MLVTEANASGTGMETPNSIVFQGQHTIMMSVPPRRMVSRTKCTAHVYLFMDDVKLNDSCYNTD